MLRKQAGRLVHRAPQVHKHNKNFYHQYLLRAYCQKILGAEDSSVLTLSTHNPNTLLSTYSRIGHHAHGDVGTELVVYYCLYSLDNVDSLTSSQRLYQYRKRTNWQVPSGSGGSYGTQERQGRGMIWKQAIWKD